MSSMDLLTLTTNRIRLLQVVEAFFGLQLQLTNNFKACRHGTRSVHSHKTIK